MNRWGALLVWELRQFAGNPVAWIVLGLLAAAMAWGACSGASLHRAQSQALAVESQADAAWLASVKERAQQYTRPSAEPLPYWQDPGDVAGFSRYFLRRHAFKPHLPLSPLAVGVSDLQPSRVPVKLETLFGIAPVYDFEPPRVLMSGRFDLGFVIAFVMPVAIVLLIGLLTTFERDRGMLRLVAAQPISPRRWLGIRVCSIAAWLLLVIALMLGGALWLAGVDPAAAPVELASAMALVLVYALFWVALSFAVVAAWPTAAGALGTLAAIWILLCLCVPLLGSAIVLGTVRAPSALYRIDALRRVTDAVEAERQAVLAAAFAGRADLAPHAGQIGRLDYATRQTFLVPERERRLAAQQHAVLNVKETRERATTLLGFVSPSLGVQSALATLAGTDMQRHRRFEKQVRDFQLHLRDFFFSRIQQQIVAPTPRPPGSYSRQNFSEFDAIAHFRFQDASAASRATAVLPVTLWLLALSVGLVGIAARRLRRWPADL